MAPVRGEKSLTLRPSSPHLSVSSWLWRQDAHSIQGSLAPSVHPQNTAHDHTFFPLPLQAGAGQVQLWPERHPGNVGLVPKPVPGGCIMHKPSSSTQHPHLFVSLTGEFSPDPDLVYSTCLRTSVAQAATSLQWSWNARRNLSFTGAQ